MFVCLKSKSDAHVTALCSGTCVDDGIKMGIRELINLFSSFLKASTARSSNFKTGICKCVICLRQNTLKPMHHCFSFKDPSHSLCCSQVNMISIVCI